MALLEVLAGTRCIRHRPGFDIGPNGPRLKCLKCGLVTDGWDLSGIPKPRRTHEGILNKTAPQNKTLKLFTHNIRPVETDIVSGSGYAATSPARWDSRVTLEDVGLSPDDDEDDDTITTH